MSGISRREKLESMLASSPADQLLRYMLALELEKEGANDRSLELLRGLTQDEQPYVPAFLMAGQQLARLNRRNDALEMYRRGIAEARRQHNEHAAGEMTGFLEGLQNAPLSAKALAAGKYRPRERPGASRR